VSAVVRHKFHAKACDLDGIRFDSKREAAYYRQLKLRVAAGEVVTFLRQTTFHLPGGVRYVCDFQVFLASGEVQFVDTKGVQTESFKAKKRMVEELYRPITITLA
jgi:hypothetical protein